MEAVWADEDFDSEESEESEPDDVSVNGFSEIEEDEFDILNEHSCKGKKVKSHHHANGRCLPSECKEICKKDGFKDGKCTASEKHDKVKKCYCVKSCHKKHKKDKKKGKKDCPCPCKPDNPPSSPPALPPADVPSSVIPDFSPADSPSSVVPGFSPAHSPSPDAPDSPILDFPVVPPTKGYASLEDDDADDSNIY